MKKIAFLISAISLFATAPSYASLCKGITENNNTIVVERPRLEDRELSFWLWPNRNAIALESAGLPSDILNIAVSDQSGEVKAQTEKFYVYASNEKAYSDCVSVATEASRKGLGIRMTIKNVHAGYYDMNQGCTGKHAWAAFPRDGASLTCEVLQ